MFHITVNERTKKLNLKEIVINGHAFTIHRNFDFVYSTLPNVLLRLRASFIDKNINEVHSILKQYKQINPTIFECVEVLFPKEFEEYFKHLCDYFFYELNEITTSFRPVLRFIITNNLEKSLHSPSCISATYYSTLSVPKQAFSSYLDDKFLELMDAFRQDNLNLIRTLSFPLGEKTLIERIYSDDTYIETFESFVERLVDSLSQQEESFSAIGLSRYIFGQTTREEKRRLLAFTKLEVIKKAVSKIYTSIANKPNSYQISDDIWFIKRRNIQGFNRFKLDFSLFSNKDKPFIKRYIHELVEKTSEKEEKISRRLHSIRTLYSYFTELPYKEVTSLSDLNYYHLIHLRDYLQQLLGTDGKRKYTVATIHGMFTVVRIYMDWYIENINPKQSNTFRELKFHNVKAFSENTSYIPESVIEQLENKLHHLPEPFQNAWTIMINCGLRFSDVQHLKLDCITYDNEINSYVMTYRNVKMQTLRVKNGEPIYHTIPVSQIVVDAVERQKEITNNLRVIANTDYLFITFNNSAIVKINPVSIAHSINTIIKRYNICDENGELYHYKNHQCRKTLIVDLLSQGMSLRQVADYVNHSEETSALHYRDVENKKIAQLDKDMFEQLFMETLDEDITSQYEDEELESLFKEVKLGARETPEGHGTCVKHVSFGPCHKKSCVGCKMLVSGPQKLPKWYQLYKEQQMYINELANEYQQMDISNFQEHRIYQQESHLLGVYKETINKIEKWAERRGISIEQYKN
ncbi:tyrosine-type recombinase/integrase [Priestia filamentosa]|uniref:tyrosine-type recombinase/integrase n=1 Tax=Priestia filamentosa TaxID=1402861 RepID=UPI000A08C84D|nr:site-specific integrase [Priestia filamentosa]SMF18556.1 Phage integrase family protein [Priestia filamentosa]